MSANIPKVVNFIEAHVNNELSTSSDAPSMPETITPTTAGNPAMVKTGRTNPPAEEFFVLEPTIWERFMRYFWIVVYLCGLCSLGFVLSIYHLFFWDSRMPKVHHASVLKKSLYIKP